MPASAAATPAFKAAIIGHTGRGNYGHEIDTLFAGLKQVQVVAVADSDPNGLKRALAKTGAARGYSGYQEMLDREQPGLVAVAPRHTDQHHAMIGAALRSGAHVYSEKPFTTTLAEADELLAMAGKAELRIAVAHQMRMSPSVVHLKAKLESGIIGQVVGFRSHGKQDSRAGGEDMIVLGTHLFDMMRFFGGDVVRCQAMIREKGRKVSKDRARAASENIGPVLGDEIEARFEFASGLLGTFTSNGRLRETLGPWGIEILGTKGSAWILMDIFPRVFVRTNFENSATRRTEAWEQMPDDPGRNTPDAERGFATANRRVVEDWLQAIANRREPACSALNAARAIEMAMGVYESALAERPVEFPLVRREHPLRS